MLWVQGCVHRPAGLQIICRYKVLVFNYEDGSIFLVFQEHTKRKVIAAVVFRVVKLGVCNK